MRLLIYLLALVSGLSAADAARAEVSSPSTVAQTAIAAAEAHVAEETQRTVLPASAPGYDDTVPVVTVAFWSVAAATPVAQHDSALE
jgi:hypothetical protein